MIRRSNFLKWFEAQHGKPPVSRKDEIKLHAAVIAGNEAQDKLRHMQEYEARKESALYAWNARAGQ